MDQALRVKDKTRQQPHALDEGVDNPLPSDSDDPDGRYVGSQQGYEAYLEAWKSKGAAEKVSHIVFECRYSTDYE